MSVTDLRSAVAGSALALSLLVLSGCGADDPITPSSSSQSTSSGPTGSVSGTPSSQPQNDETSEPTGDDLGAVAGSRTASMKNYVQEGSGKVKAELFEPRRSDSSLSVTVRLTVVSISDKSESSFNLGDALSDKAPDVADNGANAPDGIRVIDGKNKKVHLPASDGKGQCFCNPRQLGVTDLSVGDSTLVSVVFAAPPADVERVDVQIPSFGTFSQVKVS
jgi:hypothetical protein